VTTDAAENKMSSDFVSVTEFNSFWNSNNSGIESFIDSVRTGFIDLLWLNEGPVDEEFGRRVALALASNTGITHFWLSPSSLMDVAVRDVIQWLTTCTIDQTPTATLAPFTNLTTVYLNGDYDDRSFDDWDLILRLLLTSTTLRELFLLIGLKGDRVMSALAQYVRAASRVSLRDFSLDTTCSLSEAEFVSVCDGVAGSQLRKLTLRGKVSDETYLETETAAESLARALSIPSLEEVKIGNPLWSALFHNLARTNIPLGLWPQTLEKAHTLPFPSLHCPDIIYSLLRENPNLVRNTGR
jgi:hypothetical protein